MLRRFSKSAPPSRDTPPTPLLNTPAQNDYQNPKLELREKTIKKWLATLPILNPVISIPALLERLTGLNREPLAPKARVRLLELFRTPVNTIFDSFDEAALHQLPVSREKRAQITEAVSELCTELATGYKILIKEGCNQGRSPARDTTLAIAMERAMEQLSHGLIHAYRSYSTVPPFSYLEVHQIYRFAEAHGTAITPGSGLWARGTRTSVGQLYAATMLISALDPHRLKVGECTTLWKRSVPLAQHVMVRTFVSDRPLESGEFYIDLSGDSPPRPNHLQPPEGEQDALRVLDTRPAQESAMERLARLDKEPHKKQAETEAHDLHLILKLLDTDRTRKDERIASGRHVRLAIGLDAVHYFLANHGEHICETLADSRHGVEVRDAGSESDAGFSLEDWRVADESIKGFLLRRHRIDHDGLQVGDLTGVLSPTEGSGHAPLSIAIIRWIRTRPTDMVEMGIETIPGLPKAAHYRLSEAPPDTCSDACILLPAVPALKVSASLIVPTGTIYEGASLQLRRDGETLQITVERLLSEMAGLEQFHFSSL